MVAFKSGSILEGPGRIQDDSAPFGELIPLSTASTSVWTLPERAPPRPLLLLLCLAVGNGSTFQTVREHLRSIAIVSQADLWEAILSVAIFGTL